MAESDQEDEATVPAFSAPPERPGRPAPPGSPPDRREQGAKTFGPDGRYQVVAQLGKGGFGTVFKAYDHRLAKYVAIKTINVSDIPPNEIQDYVRYFDNEAKTAAQLEHPGVVTVLDYDPYADEPYLVMPLVECGTLRDWFMQHPRMPWPQVLDLAIQLGEALDHAHTHGIRAHRDIKPANIFVAADGRYRVGDFGIARKQRMIGSSGATRSTFLSAGTPRYMAPEQVLYPRTVDGRSDLFAICVVLYEALTGRLPFRGVTLEFDPEDDLGSAQKIVEAAFAPPIPIQKLAPDVPGEFARIIERGLQRNPNDRFRNCAEFADALKDMDIGRSLRPKLDIGKWVRRAAILGLFGALGTAGYHFRAEIQQQGIDWYYRLTSEPVEPPTKARAEAVAAQAEQFAPDTWRKAEASIAEAEALDTEGQRGRADNLRRDALTLYRKAAQAAWQARIDKARAEGEEARKLALALSVRGDVDAEKAFDEAESVRRRAEGIVRSNPRQAAEQFEAALTHYESAARDIERVTIRGVLDQLDQVKRSVESVPVLPNPPPDLTRQADAVRVLVVEVEQQIQRGDIIGARPQLAKADTAVHDLAFDTVSEARRRTERARSEARAKGPLPPEQEQHMASAERSYGKAIDRLGQPRKADELFEILTLFTQAQAEFAAVGVGNAEVTIRVAEAARAEADTAQVHGAPTAQERYLEGVRLLGEARKETRRDAARAGEQAKAADALFVEAKAIAASAVLAPTAVPPMEPEKQVRVQPQPQSTPAGGRPPFEVRQDPPAAAVVVMQGGVGQQFWVRTSVRGATYRWTFDGEPMPDADGNPGLELEPSPNYREGLHTVQVTVTDREGREVSRQWMIRVQPESVR